VDSLSAAIGQRILLQRGLQLAEQNLSAREIAEILDQEKTRIRVMAVIDTLEYLKKGGRISAAIAIAGTVLSMKPVIEISDGLVAMAGKARGNRQANTLLRQLMDKYGGANLDAPYALVYSGLNDDHLQKFIAEQTDLWPETANLPIHSLGCVIGTHVGPGAYGIAFFEK
jgi:DegV family protein with EDD domain